MKKRVIICAVVIGLAASTALAVYNLGSILAWVCAGEDVVAELRLGGDRAVIITAERCWENDARATFYRIEEAGRAVVPETFIGAYAGDDAHELSAVYAEGGAVVGVVEAGASRRLLIVMHDFKTGGTWPRPPDNETQCDEHFEQRGRELYGRLQRENPGLPPLADYCG